MRSADSAEEGLAGLRGSHDWRRGAFCQARRISSGGAGATGWSASGRSSSVRRALPPRSDQDFLPTGASTGSPLVRVSSTTTTMVAPVASPTIIPRDSVFPRLLPLPPHPHPIPPAPSFQRRERFINYRDIWREMEELSEEEDAVEDQVRTIPGVPGVLRCSDLRRRSLISSSM